MSFTESLGDIIARDRSGMLAVADHWERVRLGDIASVVNGFPFPSNNFTPDHGVPLLRIRDVRSDRTEAFFDGDVEQAYLVRAGELVVGMDGDFHAALWRGPRAALNQRVCKIVPDETLYSVKLLAYILPGYLNAINQATSSITVKHLSSRTVGDIPLPIPPRKEQDRLVAAIEEHLSRLDAAVAGLKRVQAQLPRYRAAVLQAAVEGRLTREDAAGVDSELAESVIPDGWRWMTIEQCAAKEHRSITDGPFGSNLKTEHYTQVGPRVVRLQNIGDGEFVDAVARISDERYEALVKHAVFPRDLIIAALGNSPPRACIVPEGIGRAIVKADCIRFKPDPKIASPNYLNIALNAEPTRARVTKMLHGVGRPRLNLSEIRAITLPVPGLGAQAAIVAEVDRRLSLARAAAAAVEAALLRAAALRQAVLRRAFSGQLVPQDPTEEPASVLMERIGTARAASPIKPGRPRRAGAR